MRIAPYSVLLKILDRLRQEAPSGYKRYHPEPGDADAVNAALAKAYVHLLLKVRFGLLSFDEREACVTDGTQDGGIDAYYIDTRFKTVYFVQSKFRHTEKNFEQKQVDAEDILRMDVERILNGETRDEQGGQYNGKVLDMARKISAIPDIGRYTYKVIVLANVKGITRQKLTALTGGYSAEVIDYDRAYKELVYPIVSGTYYAEDNLQIRLSLSDKNAGTKISYAVQTEAAKAEITVVFVPTIEIARTMLKYRNSILELNPRSYMEHDGQNVNASIRSTIIDKSSNEFALFNNGITILSSETYINERIGQKESAVLLLSNPQIINGGQTAYTLSQIYHETSPATRDATFAGKEVLVKIITIAPNAEADGTKAQQLIQAISRATNSQTAVTNADRRSNDPYFKALQLRAYNELGFFVERKRGEFWDGIREGYLSKDLVVDRNTFTRVALTVLGRLSQAVDKRVVAKCDFKVLAEMPDERFRELKNVLLAFIEVHQDKGERTKRIRLTTLTQTYAAALLMRHQSAREWNADAVSALAKLLSGRWSGFLEFVTRRREGSLGRRGLILDTYVLKSEFLEDLVDFFVPAEQPS